MKGKHCRDLAAAVAIAVPICCSAASPVLDDPEKELARRCTPDLAGGLTMPAECDTHPRLRAHEPIYAIYQTTDDDERAFRLNYSFRYMLFQRDCLAAYREARESDVRQLPRKEPADHRAIAADALKCLDDYNRRDEIYLTYTGQFDFYWTTRPSGPVINRISNPGFHYRRHVNLPWGPLTVSWLDAGVEHRSNGQTTDAKDAEGRLRAQAAYEANDHAYLDSISQDTNFFALETALKIGRLYEVQARLKAYFSNETNVTWGPHADTDVQMSDYDRARVIVTYRFDGGRRKLDAEWTVGDKGLKTDSFDLGLYFPAKLCPFRWRICELEVPWYARAHFGPLHTLSDFTQRYSSFGFGVLLLE